MFRGGSWLALAFTVGCGFDHGALPTPNMIDGSVANPDMAVTIDAPPDMPPPGQVCLGVGLYSECYDPGALPSGTFQPGSATIDTGNNASCDLEVAQSNGYPELCVKRAGSIVIDTYVRWRGTRALVLVAADTITVTNSGVLDVSSIQDSQGAGGTSSPCNAAADGADDTGSSANAGGGGGAGGSFGTGGGGGGAGQNSGGVGGPGTTTLLADIRGGCRGGQGGDSSDGNGGRAGMAGGAVYLIARNSITIDGAVLARGGGGEGGPNKGGGGGGGSGGFIGLDAPTITTTGGELNANGGGGGEGGGAGSVGEDGSVSQSYMTRAEGGDENPAGGDGGNGSIGTSTGQAGGTANNGGGGGGGGGGRIKTYPTQTLGGNVSPPAT